MRIKYVVTFLLNEFVMLVTVILVVVLWLVLFPFLFWNKGYWAWFKNIVKALTGGCEE